MGIMREQAPQGDRDNPVHITASIEKRGRQVDVTEQVTRVNEAIRAIAIAIFCGMLLLGCAIVLAALVATGRL